MSAYSQDGLVGGHTYNKTEVRSVIMAKVKQFQKILDILKEASPNAVTKEELATKLGNDVALYRISTYIWEIKNKAQVDIETVKDGRTVVAFKLASPVAVPATNDTEVSSVAVENAEVATA